MTAVKLTAFISLSLSFYQKAAFTREALAMTMMAASVAVTPPSTNRAKVRDALVMNRRHFEPVQMGNFSHYYNQHYLCHFTVVSCSFIDFFFFTNWPFFFSIFLKG